ncbi:MAG: glycosyltransferase [Cyanobacteria bacterium P01_D01_bin.105]
MSIVRSSRTIRFLLGGGVAALFNLVLIAILIEYLGFDTPLLRSVANFMAMECALLLSFVIYRKWVWPGGNWSTRHVLLRQLPLYHVSAGLAIVVRTIIVFPLLDWLGVSYGVNTILGALLSAVINYTMSDRLVFTAPEGNKSDLYVPEGLSPAGGSLRHESSVAIHHNVAHTQNLSLSIVIPAYNEEGCLEDTLSGICTRLDDAEIDYDILVVNDNSKDKTEAILKRLTDTNHRISYINNYYPNGFGFAIRCGLENFKGDAVTIVMADASDPPACIIDYYKALQSGYDCVFGSRFIRGGKTYDYPQHKLWINRLANWFVKVLFSLNYNDTTNAFKAYRREVIEGISPLISHHFNLTVEMPLKAVIRGYSVKVVPIQWYNRQVGISKLKIKEMGSRYLFIVLYLFLEKTLSQGDYVRTDRAEVAYARRR